MRLLNAAIGDVLSLAFSPDSDALAATVKHQGVFLWNLGSNGVPVHLDHDDKLRDATLSFAPDGRSLAWAGGNTWNIYDRDERDVARKTLHHGLLNAVFRTPDGSRIVSEHTFPADTLIGWSVNEDGWHQDWTVSRKGVSIHRYAVDPTGRRIAVICLPTDQSSPLSTRIDLRSAVSGVVQNTGPCPYHQVENRERLIFSPDGSQLVYVHGMTLVVWSVPELGKPLLIRNNPRKSRKHFTSAAFHPSGRYLFASSNDETVHVYDTTTWEPLNRFSWNIGQLRSVGISADGTLAAAGNDKGEVMVWDVDQ
jgi:WD40 repeat protein